jgi:hypothetical protein
MIAGLIALAVLCTVLALAGLRRRPDPALVPKTGLNLPSAVTPPVPVLRNQIVNIRWRINQ